MASFILTAFGLTLMISSVIGSPANNLLILRVRKADGSMDRVVVPKDEVETTTLASILSTYSSEESDEEIPRCQIGTGSGPSRQFIDIMDANQSISSFNLQNGSIINIIPNKSIQDTNDNEGEVNDNKADIPKRYTEFDPFPEIAKSSHSLASRRSVALSRLPSKRSMSYGDISKLRDHMHVIEPQPNGPIKRIYMCHLGAQRFKDNCTIMPTKKQLQTGQREIKYVNRCAVLFGSVNTERVDQSKRKARTSLSTPLYEMETCKVVKVHAVWEPSAQSTDSEELYDYRKLRESEDNTNEFQRALRLAKSLGLDVVGWIYSYSDDRQNSEGGKASADTSNGEDALPVFGRDLIVGAMGQIDNMQRIGRENGCQFITLALDAKTGATEAFQLSDVSVQMVAEGKVDIPKRNARHLETNEPVVVDAKETKTLDSVLCLVNTAMLSHEGRFSGGESTTSVTKKGGTLTARTKKTILKKLDDDSERLMGTLCDFNILMALDRAIGEEEMKELCSLVKKYSRGQRKAAQMSKKLMLLLRNVVGA